MKLKKLESGKDFLKVEVAGETPTLLNLLREKCGQSGAEQASYIIEHPYLSEPKILVWAKDPKNVLEDAAQLIIKDCKAFSAAFRAETK